MVTDERLAEMALKASQNPHMWSETAAFRELQSLRAQGGVRVLQRVTAILENPSQSPAHDLGAIRQALSSLEGSPAPVREDWAEDILSACPRYAVKQSHMDKDPNGRWFRISDVVAALKGDQHGR